MTRSQARELLMQLLFQMEVQNDYSAELKDRFIETHFQGDHQRGYASSLCGHITDNLKQIDKKINECASKWSTERMVKVDLAIVRLALGEIFYTEGIPDAVAINEAVDMAKKFGTEGSKKFVNGILGKIVKDKDEE